MHKNTAQCFKRLIEINHLRYAKWCARIKEVDPTFDDLRILLKLERREMLKRIDCYMRMMQSLPRIKCPEIQNTLTTDYNIKDFLSKTEKNIVIVSKYDSIVGENIFNIVYGALTALGFNVIYSLESNDVLDINNSIVIFLMPPEQYVEVCYNKIRNNNIFILWNLEYIDPSMIETKFASRYNAIQKMAKGEMSVDYVWIYDKIVYDLFKHDNIFYVPVGTHPSICFENKKINLTDVLFIGNRVPYRRRLMREISENSPIKIVAYDHVIAKTTIENCDIGKFRYSIILAGEEYIKSASILRIMLLASNKVLIFSHLPLEYLGFYDGIDYIYFSDAKDFIKKYTTIFNDARLHNTIVKNMKRKIMKKFDMQKIFQPVLSTAMEPLLTDE